jgi:protein SDA1
MTNSSSIRAFILKTILSDVKNANAKTQNHKFNKLVQGMLYDMIERSSSATASSSKTVADYSGTGTRKSQGAADSNTGKEAMWAVKLASELWRKGIWKDARTANLLSSACFHTNTKVQSAAMHFFLNASGSKGVDGDDSDEDGENEGDANVAMGKIRAVKHRQEINKKRKATEKAAKKEIKRANDKRKAQELKEANGEVNNQVDNSALNLLHDPQTFGERLYDLLAKNDKRFTLEHKVLIMQLYGRLSGLHKLSVLPFYSYVSKYLTYSQLSITTILVALATSVHELIPPDTLIPVIRKLAHEFVHPGVSSQVIAAGLNSIREICKRQIWAMEHDLLEDLVDYRKSKDKGIMVASRALLQLYRDQMPEMLRKRERGKTAAMAAAAGKGKDSTSLQFGTDKDATTTIEGLDLLQDYLEEKRAEKAEANAGLEGAEGAAGEEDDEDQDGWEVDSSASEDSETGWIAVSSDEEGGEVFDDSEDEDLRAERRAKKKARFSKPAESDESDNDSDSDGDDEEDAEAQEALKADKLEVTKEEMAVLDNEKENKLTLAATKVRH